MELPDEFDLDIRVVYADRLFMTSGDDPDATEKILVRTQQTQCQQHSCANQETCHKTCSTCQTNCDQDTCQVSCPATACN